LISRLLEYTPTNRLSAIEALTHPFFDDLRDPNTKLPDSRSAHSGVLRDLPPLFNFNRHGTCWQEPPLKSASWLTVCTELSIMPEMNNKLVPPHARRALAETGIDLENFRPMTKDEMMAKLD